MKCDFRYGEDDFEVGHARTRYGRPCPNEAKHDGRCWQHRRDLKEVVKAQKAVLWLLWGIEHGTV